METSDHGVSHTFKNPGAAANDLAGMKKMRGEESFKLKLELKRVGILNVVTDNS
jgi:hypothetical protein